MMASDGNGHHQPFSFAEVFTGGDFGNAVARTHIGGMLHIGEREPRHSRIMNGVGMKRTSFVESRSGLQAFHLGFCPTNKDEFVRIVFKSGKRKGVVGTPHSGFGQKTVITHHSIAFDAVAELFHGSRGSHDAVKDEQGKGNAFVFGFLIRARTIYVDRHSKKRIVKSTEMFVMFSSVPSSNIDDLLYLIHSKHSFLSFTTEGTEDTEIL